MNDLHRRRLLQLSTMATVLLAPGALLVQGKAEDAVSLFNIVTVKDEVLVGLTAAELDQFGGRDAGAMPAPCRERHAHAVAIWRAKGATATSSRRRCGKSR
jgi:hypothetical protein